MDAEGRRTGPSAVTTAAGQHFDPELVRGHFPALAGDWVFLDNAGGSQIARQVLGRLNDHLLTSNVQLGATYEPSRLAAERVREGVKVAATLVNAADPSEIVLGPTTSQNMRTLARGLAHRLAPGDEVVVTDCDHEANIGPWVALESRGIEVRTWRIRQETLDLHLDDLDALLGPRTRLVAVTHTSNILGGINPVRAIADLVHDRGALLCVDGVATAPHLAVDVVDLDVDFYGLSLYKVYGPHVGVLYGKREHLLEMPGENHYFIGEDEIPLKFQPGNVNYELASSLRGLGDYLGRLSGGEPGPGAGTELRRADVVAAFDSFAAHEESLSARLLDFLATKPRARVIGPETADREVRVPTISFVVDGRDSKEIVDAVDPHRIGIRYGDFYAARLIDTLGLRGQNGVVRVSAVHYNTIDEIDRLVEVLDPLI